MQITLFGMIWLLISCAFLFLKKEYLVYLTMLGMVFQANNVVVIRQFGVGPQMITSGLLIIKLLFSKKMKFNKDMLKYTIIILCMIILASISTLINRESNYLLSFSYIIKIMVYIITTFMLCLSDLEKDDIYKCLKNIGYFILIIGFIQFFMSASIIPKSKIMNMFIYNDMSKNVVWNNGDYNGYARMYSTFMEPSYCAAFLVGYLFFCLEYFKNNKVKKSIITIIIIIAILLTKSTTAIVAFAINVIIYFIVKKQPKKLIVYGCIGVCAFFVMYLVVPELVDKVLLDKLQSGSAIERNKWNKKAITAFLKNPIIGVGFKNARASTIALTILGELGIISFLLYYYIVCSILIKKIKDKDIVSFMLIISVSICQLIACPDLDLCVFWLFMYISFSRKLTPKIKEEFKEEKNNEENINYYSSI